MDWDEAKMIIKHMLDDVSVSVVATLPPEANVEYLGTDAAAYRGSGSTMRPYFMCTFRSSERLIEISPDIYNTDNPVELRIFGYKHTAIIVDLHDPKARARIFMRFREVIIEALKESIEIVFNDRGTSVRTKKYKR